MAYAPQALQPIIFRVNPQEQVPTPISINSDAALSLLPSPTPAASNTPLPQLSSGNLQGFVQPTPFAVEPTPTLTPVYASASNDPRAADRNNDADLTKANRLLTGFTWVRQGANNCGPASIATLMSYWNVNFTQDEAAEYLKPNPEDPNVRPEEIAAFVETKGFRALVRVNGNIGLLKQFILTGYPVLIETGYDPEPQVVGWTSHYLTLVGFSDEDQEFIAMDTYRRPNWGYRYEEIDQYWRQFNRRYIVVYRPDQAAAVASLVGADIDENTMYANALRTAQFELSVDRNDPFGWFNLGSSLVGLNRFNDAASAFDQARKLGLPSRFLWYQFTIFEAYLQMGGDYNQEVVVLADAVLSHKATEEAFYYKAMALRAEGDLAGARQQLQLALKINENYQAAKLALQTLGSS
jgi:tetratricopeptide (TPR) repeat protein